MAPVITDVENSRRSVPTGGVGRSILSGHGGLRDGGGDGGIAGWALNRSPRSRLTRAFGRSGLRSSLASVSCSVGSAEAAPQS